jgi:hypothetical protein
MAEFRKEFGTTLGPLNFPQLDKQARALDMLLRSLPKSREYEYRHAVIAKAPTELNPGERSDVSWISTETVDRTGEVVISRGMNNSQFVSNPVVTLGHAYYLPPVGRSLWQKRVKDGDTVGIKAKTQYPQRPTSWSATEPWPPDKVLTLVQAGLMQGKSIGFLPTRAHFADAKEAKKNDWPDGVIVFEEWLLLEYAVCFLPVNQDALVQEVSKGLELPPDFLKAMGLEEASLRKSEPHPPTVDPERVVAFTALSEVERAVQARLAGMDWDRMARTVVQESLDRMRGKV